MLRTFRWYLPLGFLILGMMACPVLGQTDNVIGNADLEIRDPYFWVEDDPGGTIAWTQEQAHDGVHSIKITKTTTGTAASMISGNQAQTYWNAMADELYDFGGWIMVSAGANASSSTAGERIGLLFTFEDAGGADIVAPVFLAADPAVADWQEVTSQVLLTAVPETVTCEMIIEANATGTVYFDDFALGSAPWTAGFFGADLETPVGWLNWAAAGGGYANADTSTLAHSGSYAAKLIELDDVDDEMVFYTIAYAADPNTDYIVGAWAKNSDVNTDASFYPSGILSGDGAYINDRANVCFFFHAGSIVTDWSPTGGDQFMYLDQRAADVDWTSYWGLINSPADATGVSVRARYNNFATGTTLYDDFYVYKVTKGANLVGNGDLETMAPNFWSEGETGGTLTWAEDEAYAGLRSLKIEKTTTGTAASWISANQAQTYWNAMTAALYDIGGWINIDAGASASAVTDGERIGLLFSFLDDGGADIVAPVFLAADPATADWQEVTGQVLLTTVPVTVTCEAVIEAGATGTAWFDSFALGSDPWTAGFFGADVESPTGWLNWAAAGGGFAQVADIGDKAYSGTHVGKLLETDDADDEMVFYTDPYTVEPNTWYEFTVMVRIDTLAVAADSLITSAVLSGDGAYINDRASVCFFFHAGNIVTDWSPTGGDQFVYIDAREDSTGWVEYRAAAMSPSDATGASMRARFNSFIEGEVWYDDFEIRKLTVQEVTSVFDPRDGRYSALPSGVELHQNFPNPFNMTTEIRFNLPKAGQISLEVFDVLGRRVGTVYEGVMTAGSHTVSFSVDGQKLNLSTGIYFYRLNTPDGQMMRKMLYLK